MKKNNIILTACVAVALSLVSGIAAADPAVGDTGSYTVGTSGGKVDGTGTYTVETVPYDQ